jgi:hypothetical protein
MDWLGYIIAILFIAAVWTKVKQIQADLAAIREDLRALRDRP